MRWERWEEMKTNKEVVELHVAAYLGTQGEVDLVRRALRIYAHNEQRAIQDAATGRDNAHADDVRQQCMPRIKAAGELIERLLHDPKLTGQSRYRSKPVAETCEQLAARIYNEPDRKERK